MTTSGPDADRLTRSLVIPPEHAGRRLDQAVAALLPEFSRSRLKAWIVDGELRVDGREARPRERVEAGQTVELDTAAPTPGAVAAQPLSLDVVHTDADLLVINKPAGLVVHPGAGNPDHTLQNGLLHHDPGLVALPRCGIVHRLDKDTTGLMVVARTPRAHVVLVAALAARRIRREYLALCHGEFSGGGTVDAPITRHPRDRLKMAVQPGGREAVTHYRLLCRFRGLALLRVRLETGRTHQIRVHMAHLRHPLVGDPVYGGRQRVPPGLTPQLRAQVAGFGRQALHAWRLALEHPVTGEPLAWQAPPPEDMTALLEALVADSAERGGGVSATLPRGLFDPDVAVDGDDT